MNRIEVCRFIIPSRVFVDPTDIMPKLINGIRYIKCYKHRHLVYETNEPTEVKFLLECKAHNKYAYIDTEEVHTKTGMFWHNEFTSKISLS